MSDRDLYMYDRYEYLNFFVFRYAYPLHTYAFTSLHISTYTHIKIWLHFPTFLLPLSCASLANSKAPKRPPSSTIAVASEASTTERFRSLKKNYEKKTWKKVQKIGE